MLGSGGPHRGPETGQDLGVRKRTSRSQRGRAPAKHVGPNGVRPPGERRSPLHNTQNLCGKEGSWRLVAERLGTRGLEAEGRGPQEEVPGAGRQGAEERLPGHTMRPACERVTARSEPLTGICQARRKARNWADSATNQPAARDAVITSRCSTFALRPKADFGRRVDLSTSRN